MNNICIPSLGRMISFPHLQIMYLYNRNFTIKIVQCLNLYLTIIPTKYYPNLKSFSHSNVLINRRFIINLLVYKLNEPLFILRLWSHCSRLNVKKINKIQEWTRELRGKGRESGSTSWEWMSWIFFLFEMINNFF